MARLTDKQKRFVAEYLVDLNATQAAIRAGYSKKTADHIGPELLGKTCVLEEVQKAMADREKRTEITQDRVLNELGKVAFAKAADYTDATLKYANKLRALELIGKHLGMFDGKTQSQNDVHPRVADLIEAVKELHGQEDGHAE